MSDELEVAEEPITTLDKYASIPIAFQVKSILDVTSNERGEFVLTERHLDTPIKKDYDSIGGGQPTQWTRRSFYARQGCLFGVVNPNAYDEFLTSYSYSGTRICGE